MVMLKYFEMLALTLSFHIVIILVSNGENFTLIPFWAVKILLWCPFEQWNFIVMPFRAGILQFCSRTTFSSRAGETYTPMIAFVRFQINVAIMFRKYSFYLPQIDEVICSPSIASNREVTGLKLQNVKKGQMLKALNSRSGSHLKRLSSSNWRAPGCPKGRAWGSWGRLEWGSPFGTIFIIIIIMIVIIMLIIMLKEVQHVWEWSLNICSMMNQHFLLITGRK